MIDPRAGWSGGVSFGCSPQYGDLQTALNEALATLKTTSFYVDLCLKYDSIYCDGCDFPAVPFRNDTTAPVPSTSIWDLGPLLNPYLSEMIAIVFGILGLMLVCCLLEWYCLRKSYKRELGSKEVEIAELKDTVARLEKTMTDRGLHRALERK